MEFNSKGLLSYLEEDPFISQEMIDIVQNNLEVKSNAPILDFDTPHPLKAGQGLVSSFMVLTKKCFNLDNTGAGKTVETLVALNFVSKSKNLIITPSDLITEQWLTEIFTWIPKGKFKIVVVDGDKATRLQQYNSFNSSTTPIIMLMTYSKCQKDRPILHPDVLILDEGTKVKDNSTQTFSSVKSISEFAEYTWILTATPITLSLGDFYWMFQMFNYDYFKTFEEEVEYFLIRSSKYNNSTVIGASDFSSFKERLFPFYIRSDFDLAKEEMISLSLHAIPLSISSAQEELFSEAKKNFLSDTTVGASIKNFSIFTRIAASPETFRDGETSPKIKFALDKISSSNCKFIVFARFIQEIDCLSALLKANNITCLSLTGENTQEEQVAIKNKFTKGSYQVLMMSAVGKFGLNLQQASSLILLDIPRSASDLEQIVGRIFRRGQESDVYVYLPYLVNTTDEDRLNILISRQKVLSEFFKLNTEDIIFNKSDTYKVGFQNKSYKQWRDQ